jgi:two-component system sensor histidine kinase SenX3
LAIVKHVAANHNGTIRLWSQPGTGSTFTMSIPTYPHHDLDAHDEPDGSHEREELPRP